MNESCKVCTEVEVVAYFKTDGGQVFVITVCMNCEKLSQVEGINLVRQRTKGK